MKNMNITNVGEGKVVLIAGGGKTYTDVAARFCRSQKSLDEIIGSPYNKKIVDAIVNSRHTAALEFDWFIFGIEGYSRVTEVQLVRKRHASYLIKSGRAETKGKRSFDVVLPTDKRLDRVLATTQLDIDQIALTNVETGELVELETALRPDYKAGDDNKWCANIHIDNYQLLSLMESFYNRSVECGVKEEDARYYKPQATEFKALIGMNATALNQWFRIRTCNRAQTEIRDLATKMMHLCKEAAPDLFQNAGPSCVETGFCPEGEQCAQCKGKVPTIEQYKKFKNNSRDYENFVKYLTSLDK